MVIRRGGRQDVRFLRDMLHHAYYWRERKPGDGPGPAALYVKGWGRPGDTVLIARRRRLPGRRRVVPAVPARPAGLRVRRRGDAGARDRRRAEPARARDRRGAARGAAASARAPTATGALSLSVERATTTRSSRSTSSTASTGVDEAATTYERDACVGSSSSAASLGSRAWNSTSPSSAAALRATRRRSARRSSARASRASSRSRSSEGRACASAASRRRRGCRPRTRSMPRARSSRSSASSPASRSSTSRRRTSGRTAVVKQMTGGVASLFKANGVTWFQGNGRFEDARSIAFDKGDDRTSASRARSSRRARTRSRPPIPGLDSPRCVDSTGLLAQTEVPRRLVVLGGGIIGCEFASIFERFGTEVTIDRDARHAHPAGGRGRDEGARKAFARRGIVVHLGKQCTKVEDTGERARSSTSARARRSSATSCSSRSGARRSSRASASRQSGVDLRPAHGHRDRRRTGARRSRTSTPPGTSPATGSSRTPRSARARSPRRTRWATRPRSASPAVPRPIYTDPEIAGVGLTEAQAREQYGDERRRRQVPVGRERARGDVG